MYSRFVFVTLGRDDAKARARIREAGACIGRGFFNEFHGDGAPSTRSNETIQFLVASTPRRCSDGLLSAGYVAHLTTKYRPGSTRYRPSSCGDSGTSPRCGRSEARW